MNCYPARLESEPSIADAEIGTARIAQALAEKLGTTFDYTLGKQTTEWCYNPESLVALLTLVISEEILSFSFFFPS